MTDSVTVTLGWGPPPNPTIDIAANAAVVTQRINELHGKVQRQQNDLAAEAEARKTAIHETEAALRAEI